MTRLEEVMGVNYGRLKAADIPSGISEAEVRSAAAELIGQEHGELLFYKHKYEMASDLLDRAAHRLSDDEAPDGTWWRDLLRVDWGAHDPDRRGMGRRRIPSVRGR